MLALTRQSRLLRQALQLVSNSAARSIHGSGAVHHSQIGLVHSALQAAACAAASPTATAFWGANSRRARWISAAAAEASLPEQTDLHVTAAAIERLRELAAETPQEATMLRLVVEGGGCSGYTYHFSLDSTPKAEDRLIDCGGGVGVLCDTVSLEFVRGSTIDYTTDIMRSAFEVVENPNASQSCGCGSSFAPKE